MYRSIHGLFVLLDFPRFVVLIVPQWEINAEVINITFRFQNYFYRRWQLGPLEIRSSFNESTNRAS